MKKIYRIIIIILFTIALAIGTLLLFVNSDPKFYQETAKNYLSEVQEKISTYEETIKDYEEVNDIIKSDYEKANDAMVRLSIIALRTPLYTKLDEITSSTGDDLCDKVREDVVSKISENWTTSVTCTEASQAITGICCSSYGRQWTIWGKLNEPNDYYCIDSSGNISETGAPLRVAQSTAPTNGIKCK